MTGELPFGDQADNKTDPILPGMHLKKEEKKSLPFLKSNN